MTQEMQNTKVVQDAYATFARGDVQALLGAFADDVVRFQEFSDSAAINAAYAAA